MICPACHAQNDVEAEDCFTCGKALHALTQGTVLAGRYEIVSPLGRGGMGRVYKAHDRVLEEHVAIKVLRPEFAREPDMARRFLSEIKLARKVTHPNVCRIHEYGEDAGVRYISMELIEGVSLKDYLHQRPITPAEAFELALGAARGLQAVHEHGIIHRDFKSSNIMVDSRGHVRLLDFGIARVAGAMTSTFGAAGHVIGTPESMSPEQALGARLDFRSDLYALGCVVFEVFSGQAVFQGETPLVTLFKHLHEAPPLDAPWAVIPGPLQAPLRVALSKDPDDRFESVAQFVTALEHAREACGQVPVAIRAPLPEGTASATPVPPETATIHRPPLTPHPAAPSSTAPYLGPAARRRSGTLPLLVAAGLLGVLAGLLWPRLGPQTHGDERPAPTLAAAPVEPASPAATLLAPSTLAGSPDLSSSPAAAPRPQPTGASAPPRGRLPSPASSPRPATDAPAQPQTGTLRLLVVPAAEIVLDDMSVGLVSSREFSLAPGPHTLLIVHPDYQPLPRKVTIRPGATNTLVLDLAEKGIRKPPP